MGRRLDSCKLEEDTDSCKLEVGWKRDGQLGGGGVFANDGQESP